MQCYIAGATVFVALCSMANANDATQGGFIQGSKASLGLRTFGFLNDNRDGAAEPSKTEEWAQGFLLKYESGFTQGTLGIGIDALLLTGVTLDSGQGRHQKSTMIPSDGDHAADTWTRFAPTAKARIGETEIRYGTLIPKLPILVANDGRVLPQTFEGTQITSTAFKSLTLTGGVLEHVVGRGSTDSTGFSIPGSNRESNKFYFAGGDWAVTGDLKAQYYFAKLDEFYTQHFAGVVHRLALDESKSFTTDLRYFKTDATGANSSADGRAAGYRVNGYTQGGTGEIDNDTWSLSGTYADGGHALMLGYQRVSTGSDFVQPSQSGLEGKGAGGASTYLATDRIIHSFNRAGEQTVFAQYAYDFVAMGIPGLKASVAYVTGDQIRTSDSSNASEWERDFTLDYAIQSGVLKGVGLGWRNAKYHSEVSRNQDQNRVFITYTIPLL